MKQKLLFLLVVSCFYKTILNAQCITQGPNNGSAFNGTITPGDQSWINPGSSQDPNGVYASSGFIIGVLSVEPTKFLTASGFNFNIPLNSVIAGIQVDIKRKSNGINLLATIEDKSVRLMKGGVFVGIDKASTDYWPIFNSAYKTYGGPNDLWGTTWTPADVNAPGFGAAISAKLGGLVSLLPSANVDHIRITVNYSLLPSLICSSSNLCKGDSTLLTASNNTTYTWTPGTGLSSTTGSSVIATPSVTTTYTVTGLTGNCITTNTLTINVKSSPVIAISTPTNGSTICEGNSVSFSATGADSYTWSPSYGLSSVTATNVTASPSLTTTYSVVGTAANGCTNKYNASSITINVNSAPQLSLNATSNSICNGGSNVLSVSGANSYSWSPSVGLSSVTGSSVSASPTVTIVYQVTGTSLSGCLALSATQVTVTVSNSPVLNLSCASAGNKICKGQSTSMVASGASSYTWSPSTGLNTINGANVTANPTVTTIYTVTAIATGGCSGSLSPKTITLTVNSGPNISTSITNGTLCEGTGTPVSASGANSYTWSPAVGLNTVTGASVTASPLATTVYTVFGTASNGCDNSFNPKTFTISVNSAPSVNINSSSLDNSICAGKSATLTATGASTYTWSPVATLSSGMGAMVIANPTVTTVYTVLASASNGCTNALSPATLTITVNTIPTVSLSSTDEANSVCIGGNIGLTASGASSYTWSPSSTLNSSTGPNVIASPTVTTVYNVIGESEYGCSNISSPQTFTVIVNPSPNISLTSDVMGDTICMGQPITISVLGTATSYTWNNGMNSQNIIVTPSSNTVYDVISTNTYSCTASGSEYVVVVDPATINLALQSFTVNTVANNSVTENVSVGSTSVSAGPIVITQNPIHGTANILNGVISYTPNFNYEGTDTIYYSICDNLCTNACRIEKLLIIIDSDLIIPGVLSPNGDGIHDNFYIRGLSKYSEPELVIFNRWGDIVYSAKPYQNDWSGQSSNTAMKVSGSEVLDGTYFYLLTLDSESKAIKGFFELKRK